MFHFLFVLIAVYAIFTFLFAVTSFKERALRAGIFGLTLSLMQVAALVVYAWAWRAGLLAGDLAQAVQIGICVILVAGTLVFFLPLGRNRQALAGTQGMREGNQEKFNQKDTAFNVAHVGGYGADVGKKRWALQSQDIFGGIYWTLVMGLRHQVDGKVNPVKQREGVSPEEVKSMLRNCDRPATMTFLAAGGPQ